MATPKIMIVYGTRPEAIKVAPVIKALEADPRLDSVVVSTGQHREMLDQVNGMFGISPHYDLSIMRQGQSLNGIVARAIEGLDEVIEKEQPDVVISQGDTSTAMAAAIAGFNRRIKVVHLEAGLRTGNLDSPFPEEANRKLIGQVSSLHLAPTEMSRDNLLREAVPAEDVVVTGNTVIDALLEAVSWDTQFTNERLKSFIAQDRRMVLVTTHRRENLEDMAAIGRAMRRISEKYPEVFLVLPAHLNPAVRAAVFPEIEGRNNILITEPAPYDRFTKLMGRADIVLTDSGGVQEEAPSLGKPVLVMRENTERPEAVTAGTVRLIGTGEDRIVEEVSALLDGPEAYDQMANAVNPYGDGRAAERAVAAIAELVGVGERAEDFSPKVMQH
ncbi:non-hydrolyzing UDP-N-acetylglucosamine 2-epimerase [Corynebacterium sp. A21]|uniref:non-hydrolyzing UDP-N-acetylglucosamine 2-epimerase n=1 Tax=Corynebacterium sp. A21 TaxID=3457318 RepID=UPI003FD29743